MSVETHQPLTSDRIGVERLCVFNLPPVELVHLAAQANCRYIGIGLTPMRFNPHGYPAWSLKDDPALRHRMRAAMQTHGVAISLCEGFGVRQNFDVSEFAADLDIVAELGCRRINVVSIDRDARRSFDQFAELTAMAAARGIETTTEVGPGPIPNLAAGLEARRHVGRTDFRLLIDTMHFFRAGGTVAEIAALDPQDIGYVQLCDVPRVSTFSSYMDEALHERMPPGAGELPLLEFVRAIPHDLVLGLEVPQRSLALAGVGPEERVQRCVAAARELLARRDADSALNRSC